MADKDVSGKIVPQEVDPQINPQEHERHLNDLRADAWGEFVMTGRPNALADYLEAGAELTDDLRGILIDLLRNGPQLDNRGGKDVWRDYKTFVAIKSILFRGEKLEKKGDKDVSPDSETEVDIDRILGWALQKHEISTLTAAWQEYAKSTNQEQHTVEMQFKRGEKLFGPRSDEDTRTNPTRTR